MSRSLSRRPLRPTPRPPRRRPQRPRPLDQPPAAGHTVWIETFVDTSRRTEPATGPALDSRTLETTIYRPNGDGPFPLVAFAHGFNGHPEKFTKLFSAWADAGLVVVAPAFPLTNSHVPQTAMGDVAAQTDDVRFVIDRVLELAESSTASCTTRSTPIGSGSVACRWEVQPPTHSGSTRRAATRGSPRSSSSTACLPAGHSTVTSRC